jgi:hypothetical protein
MAGSPEPLFHPSHNVIAGRKFPFVDADHVAERYQFVPDPERPVAIPVCIAHENVGH